MVLNGFKWFWWLILLRSSEQSSICRGALTRNRKTDVFTLKSSQMLWMILRHWEWLVPRFMQSFHPMRRNYWWGQRALEDVSKYQYKSIQFNTNKTNKIKGCVSNGNLGHVTAQFRICDPCDRKIGWIGPWGVAQGVTAGRRPESSLSATVLSSGHRGFSHWKWQGVVSVDIGIEQFIIVHSCSFYSYFRCLKMF